jgi:hypothetical protein
MPWIRQQDEMIGHSGPASIMVRNGKPVNGG